MEWVEVIKEVGFLPAILIAFAYALYKFVARTMDESKERESSLNGTLSKFSDTINKISETIEKTNILNRELSETNRLLVDKVQDTLTDMSYSISKILTKLDINNDDDTSVD